MTNSSSDAVKAQSLSGRLVHNSLWNLAAYGAFLILMAISGPVFIRYLGLARYGLLVLLTSLLAPMSLLNFGFGEATVKYVAECYARGDVEQAGQYLRSTLLFNIGIGLLGAAAIALLAPFLCTSIFKIPPTDQPSAAVALRWIALSWLVTEISGTFSAVPTAMQRYRLVSLGTTLEQGLNIALGLLVLVVGGDFLALISARFFFSLAATLGWMMLARRLLAGVSLWPRFHAAAFRHSFGFGIWQALSSLGGMLGAQADRFLLGIYVSTAAVGLFNIPQTVFSAGYIVVSRLGEVLFPAVSDLQGRGDEGRLRGVVLQSSWLLVVLMTAIMGTIVVFAHDLLRLYMGDAIADQSAQILRILAAQAIFSAASVGLHQYLRGTAHTPWLALTSAVTGVLTALVSIVLVPRYGLHGAAWSQLIAIVLSRPLIASLIWRSYWRDFKPWRTYMAYFYGPSVIGILGTGVLLLVRNGIAWQPGWIGLAGAATLCALVLGALILAFDRPLPECSHRMKALWLVVLIVSRRLLFLGPGVLP